MNTNTGRLLVIFGIVAALSFWLFRFAGFLPLKDGYYSCFTRESVRPGTPVVTGAVIKNDSIYTVTGRPGEVSGSDWNPVSLPLGKEGTRRFGAGIAVRGDGWYIRYSCMYEGILVDEDGREVGGD